MPRFLKFGPIAPSLDSHIYPAERIAKINRTATINGALGIEVSLHGMIDTWQYTGDTAGQAYDILQGIEPTAVPPGPPPQIVVTIDGKPTPFDSITLPNGDVIGNGIIQVADQQINVNDILWIDLNANFNGQPGIEVRVVIDPPGMTRQFTGQAAETAYDALVALVPEESASAAS